MEFDINIILKQMKQADLRTEQILQSENKAKVKTDEEIKRLYINQLKKGFYGIH